MKEPIQNKNHLAILRSGKSLFWKHGFRRVSVEDICRDAGVSRMTFYRFFPNKLTLAKDVLSGVIGESIAEFRRIIHADTPASQKLHEMIMMKANGVHDISQEFMQDFYQNADIGLITYISEQSAAAWQEMMKDFRAAQEVGLFRKDLNLEFFFLFSQKAIEFTKDETFTKLFPNPEELILELTNMFVYGISPHEP